jgi:uncharacterized sulfatase
MRHRGVSKQFQSSLTVKPIFPLIIALLLGPLAVLRAADAKPAKLPNVLFIAVDDLNTRIGCYGDLVAKTPHLDRLARQGIRFARAYCQFPQCNQSRVSMLLGRYPTTTQVVDLFTLPALLGRDWVSLPQHFRNNGYDVQLAGKVYHWPQGDGGAGGQRFIKDWFQEEPPGREYPPDWSWGEKWVRKSQEVHAAFMADLNRYEPGRTPGPPSGFYPALLRKNTENFGPVPDGNWSTDVKNAGLATDALERVARADKPFFLALGFHNPHCVWQCPQRFFDLHPAEKMVLPDSFMPRPTLGDSVPRDAVPDLREMFHYGAPPTPERAREAMAAYYACTSFVDEQVGRVLDSLERLGLRDNTIIVLFGDNGFQMGESGIWGKLTLFEPSIRVPLIVVDPREKATAGQECLRTVQLLDIYPTLAELCGLPMPPGLEGNSLGSLLDRPQAAWDHPAFAVLARGEWLARSIRTERWSYTEWDEGRQGAELYDHETDPGESKNLVSDPKHAAIIAELKKRLHASPVAKHVPLGQQPAAPKTISNP